MQAVPDAGRVDGAPRRPSRSPALALMAVVLTAGALALAGCSRGPESHASGAAQSGPVALGPYRATLELPDGELPFEMEITREDGSYVAYLVNGPERLRVPEVLVEGDRIEMRMPGFENRLSARIVRGRLIGEAVFIGSGGQSRSIPFEARHGVTHRFVDRPLTDNADVSGRWAVTFTDDSGQPTPAIGEFRQNHHRVTGSFLTPTGDHRYLAGDVRDDEIFLSTFDGAHAFLYHGRVNARGEIEGTFWSGLGSRKRFVARRDDSASLPDAGALTTLKADAAAFDFTFPDLEGRPVSLRDPRFEGKVVVIALGGSWCPNCHDETAFLAPYYLHNRERGLEVVALMFEHFADFERAAAAVQRLQRKYDVRYPMLIAGTSDKEDAAAKLPQLSAVHAFPTTLFLDRRGRVRHIHTGFFGPGTGEHHQELIESFDAMVEQLLAETDGAAGAPENT